MELNKIAGILKLVILEPDFELKEFKEKIIYVGGLNLCNSICTGYIPGIISSHYLSHKEIEMQESEEINWTNSHKLALIAKSKMWNYLIFSISDYNSDFINFVKINKIKMKYFLDHELFIYGHVKEPIIDYDIYKTNNIHSLLPEQIFYCCEEKNTYLGSIVHNKEKTKIFGITGNCINSKTIIIPLINFTKNDIFIKVNYNYYELKINSDHYKFDNDILINSLINNGEYIKLDKDYSQLKKNDIIIMIDNIKIINGNIFNKKLKVNQNIEEYLSYANNKNKINFQVIRLIKNKFEIISIHNKVKHFYKKFCNNIYISTKKLNGYLNKFNFNTDMCDFMIENNIFNLDIYKYLENPNHKINTINL